jgi:protein arginine N-methyltransferase 1
VYSVAEYGAMIADEVRTEAFARALGDAVKPGSIVLDIGTGTGIFALLACQLGARRVYGIEPSDAIEVAREMAAANGFADRIEFIQAMSTDVTLPERADVIVSDLGGLLPWYQRHLPSITDARRRFLAPGGILIPQRDTAWAAIIDAPELYARQIGPWIDKPFGLDMEAARRFVVNTWNEGRITAGALLTERQSWATLDYRVVEEANVRAETSLRVNRPGTGHGVAAGFDRTVCGSVFLSNAPDAPEAIRSDRTYGTVFFPWPSPVALERGDIVTIVL